MKEYKIKFTNEKVSLFKTNKQITSLTKKLNLIEGTVEHIPLHFSLVKERKMNYVSKVYSFGARAEKTYVGRILHSKQEILISEVDYIYRFNHTFTDQKQPKKGTDGIKKATKEELEHRRKNINYILKKIDAEEAKTMSYLSDEEVVFTDESLVDKDVPLQVYDDKKIRDCIKKAKIVNYKIISEIFPSAQNIIEILSEMCIKLNGRFILKNKFYVENLRKTRDKIFKEFICNDISVHKPISEEEEFLLSEICFFKNNEYHLKGFFEDVELVSSTIDIRKLIYENGIISVKKLKELTELGDDVYSYLEEHKDIIKLQNNNYVIKHNMDENDPRNIVINLLRTQNNLKRNEVFTAVLEKTGKELNIFVYNKIMKEFCNAKGNNWILKK